MSTNLRRSTGGRGRAGTNPRLFYLVEEEVKKKKINGDLDRLGEGRESVAKKKALSPNWRPVSTCPRREEGKKRANTEQEMKTF